MGIFLNKGDVIGVAAPSARFDRRLFEQGVSCLESMGFEVRIPKGIFGKLRYLAGTDRNRAGVVNELFTDPEVKGIISVRGGFGAMRILDHLDWEGIRANPTLFVGFSDASALISGLISEGGTGVVHGPNLVSLARAGQETLDGFYRAVTGQLKEIYMEQGRPLEGGNALGRLVGGNLATLAHMMGTRFQPDFDGGILFIEDVGEPAYKIDRMLSQMKMAGCFDRIRGVVTGSFEDCANPEYIPEIINEMFRDMEIPVFMGLAAGHGKVNLSLPMGTTTRLDADRALFNLGAPVMDRSFIRIHRAMDRAVKESVFPGAVLVWGIGSDLLFHRAYGRADEISGAPVDLHTIFDLASLTKPLATALALAELLQKGRVGMDSPLGEILPGVWNTDKAEITLDMLLRHTSGLPSHRDYFKRMPESDPRYALRQMILAEPLENIPGEKEIYSDLGYMLLAWVVEEISGRRLDHFVRDFIYAPLGLPGLFFVPTGEIRPRMESVAATSWCPWRGRVLKGEVEDENAWAAGGVEGHAGLFGDGGSVYRICCEILAAVSGKGTGVLDSQVIRSFVRQVPGMERVAGFDTPSKENSSAGRFFSQAAVGHLGFTGTSFWLDPETGLIAVLLTNRVHPSRENWKIRKFRPLIHDLIHDSVSPEINSNKPV